MKAKDARKQALNSKYNKIIKNVKEMVHVIELHSQLGYTNCGGIVKDSDKDKFISELEKLGYNVHHNYKSDGTASCIEVEWF